MQRNKILLSVLMALVIVPAVTGYALANASAGFNEKDGVLFDDWDIARTRGFGEDGFYQMTRTDFRPVIVFESLGEYADEAYHLGEQFAGKYPDTLQRAEQIFFFVRDRMDYTSDIDQFGRDEFAQNADEMAEEINQNGVAYGDCEDGTVLLAVMYKAAGYRSAIVVGRSHTAALVHLPDYKKASVAFELDGEPGWIWAEATGRNNPLGWTSKDFIGVQLATYEIEMETIERVKPATESAAAVGETTSGPSFSPFPFMSIFAVLWFLSLFRRRRSR
jgi:hypothetical protein